MPIGLDKLTISALLYLQKNYALKGRWVKVGDQQFAL